MQSKNTKTYIRKLKEVNNDNGCKLDCPPKWSIEGMDNVHIIAKPLWSADGRYISVQGFALGGGGISLIDTLSSGTFDGIDAFASPYEFNWSSSGHSYVTVSYGSYGTDTGLYISRQDNITKVINLAPKLGKTKDTPFFEADFSPDGRRIVFVFREPSPEEPYKSKTKHLAMVNTDGTGFTILVEKTDVKNPFFSRDGNSVLYFQQKNGKQVLVRYDLSSKKSSDLIIFPTEFKHWNYWNKPYWTKDGFLALVGVSFSSVWGGDIARMLILDIANKKVVYASPVAFNDSTHFVGLSN